MKEHALVDVLAGGTVSLVTRIMVRLFGPGVEKAVIGPYSWADLGAVLFIVLALLALDAVVGIVVYAKRKTVAARAADVKTNWRDRFLTAVHKPVHLFLWICGLYVAVESLLLKLNSGPEMAHVHAAVDLVFNLAWLAAFLWVFVRLTRVLEARLAEWAGQTHSRLDDFLVVLLVRSLRIIVPLLVVIFVLPMVGFPAGFKNALTRVTSILIILGVAQIFVEAVRLAEKSVLAQYNLKVTDNLRARRLYTQVHFLARAAYVVIGVFTIASVLMLFAEVRHLGTSILASAGLAGVIAGMAAQNTIGNLFAGFQLAVSQPMRIDDVLIVEGEWGTVEEITFTYVVLHIWDDRRLVIPLNYFIKTPFQNWTRTSASLLGSVILWADYSMPVAELRQAVKEIVESAPLWDKRFWNLQVSDATEHTMQLRVLCTAANSSKAWDLRCDVRERLIDYMQKHYPGSLPRTRLDLSPRPAHNGQPGSRLSTVAPQGNGR